MAQDTFGDFDATSSNNSTIEGDATDGSVSVAEGNLPSTINNAIRSVMAACNTSFGDLPAGTSRPSYLTANRYWRDTGTTDKQLVKFYDGTDDITIFTIDTAANTVTFGSGFLANVVEDTTPQLGGNLDTNGNTITSASGAAVTIDPDSTGNIVLGAATVTVEQDIAHAGDPDNLVQFGTDTQDFQTGGVSRLDLSNSGVRLGAANARVTTVLDEDTMASDSATALATQQSIKAYVDANGGGAVEFIETQDFSSTATADFTGFDATKYDSYIFDFLSVLPSGAVIIQMLTSSDGGSTFDTASSDYKYGHVGRNIGANSAISSSNNGDSAIRVTDASAGFGSGADGLSGRLVMNGPHIARFTRVQGEVVYTNGSDEEVGVTLWGMRAAQAAVDGVRFQPSSGSFASGTITMYGVKNA